MGTKNTPLNVDLRASQSTTKKISPGWGPRLQECNLGVMLLSLSQI
jgi:hypothetical protein